MAKHYAPRMHTAEHVLNQTMIRMFDCDRCFSSHLNAEKSKCDYYFERDITAAEATELEQRVNAILASDLPVTTRHVTREEAQQLVTLSKLPDSVAPDAPIRLVAIGTYDLCPCIGEHVDSTAQAGLLRLVSHSLLPSDNPEQQSVLRLRFKLKEPAV